MHPISKGTSALLSLPCRLSMSSKRKFQIGVCHHKCQPGGARKHEKEILQEEIFCIPVLLPVSRCGLSWGRYEWHLNKNLAQESETKKNKLPSKDIHPWSVEQHTSCSFLHTVGENAVNLGGARKISMWPGRRELTNIWYESDLKLHNFASISLFPQSCCALQLLFSHSEQPNSIPSRPFG